MLIIIHNITVKFNFIIKINSFKHFIPRLIINIMTVNKIIYNKITLSIF